MGIFESKVDMGSILDGVGPDRFEDLLAHLQDLERRGTRFGQVAVWHQAFLGGVADHHTVVYEYKASGLMRSLKLDFGREGLTYKDDEEDPSPDGDIILRKWCRIRPMELRAQLLDVKSKEYVLVSWNCQHFSQYFFDRASELTRDLTEVSARAGEEEPPKAAPPPTAGFASRAAAAAVGVA